MTISASPPVRVDYPEMPLATVLAALAPYETKALILAFEDGQQVRRGYHVTEVKAGSFVTLDCGGNPDAWEETMLQVEDLPATDTGTIMTAGKFRSILARVGGKIQLNTGARLTIEVSRPDEPMRVFDVVDIDVEGQTVFLRLRARPAICKPRHRAVRTETTACCG
jgi:hypothetical protein